MLDVVQCECLLHDGTPPSFILLVAWAGGPVCLPGARVLVESEHKSERPAGGQKQAGSLFPFTLIPMIVISDGLLCLSMQGEADNTEPPATWHCPPNARQIIVVCMESTVPQGKTRSDNHVQTSPSDRLSAHENSYHASHCLFHAVTA